MARRIKMSLHDIFTEGFKKQPIHADRLFVFELTSSLTMLYLMQ
ncbi:Uncharacterised protein [Actinobacillus pleuropneumoniae]|nr:Uncharacterised protein [Actinobacillus pleuropneumoniae]